MASSKLDQLRTMTDVVADTGDIEAIAQYQPVDATTNPSLLLKAALMPHYSDLIDETVSRVRQSNAAPERRVEVLADRFAVAIGKEILEIVPGRVSTEVDARLSFDTAASIDRARRLIDLYSEVGIDRERILIKLASTWEGVQAAEVLEKEGINCNLTLLFCDVQAVAAARAGAFLISPFVGSTGTGKARASMPMRPMTTQVSDPCATSTGCSKHATTRRSSWARASGTLAKLKPWPDVTGSRLDRTSSRNLLRTRGDCRANSNQTMVRPSTTAISVPRPISACNSMRTRWQPRSWLRA